VYVITVAPPPATTRPDHPLELAVAPFSVTGLAAVPCDSRVPSTVSVTPALAVTVAPAQIATVVPAAMVRSAVS
jgi:hypothetical protein